MAKAIASSGRAAAPGSTLKRSPRVHGVLKEVPSEMRKVSRRRAEVQSRPTVVLAAVFLFAAISSGEPSSARVFRLIRPHQALEAGPPVRGGKPLAKGTEISKAEDRI